MLLCYSLSQKGDNKLIRKVHQPFFLDVSLHLRVWSSDGVLCPFSLFVQKWLFSSVTDIDQHRKATKIENQYLACCLFNKGYKNRLHSCDHSIINNCRVGR